MMHRRKLHFALIAALVLMSGCSRLRPHVPTARTTLVEPAGASAGVCAAPTPQAKLAKIAALGRSKNVLSRAQKDLSTRGIAVSSRELSRRTIIEAVPGTNVLSIEFSHRDPVRAKAVVAAVADSLKETYRQINQSWSASRVASCRQRLDQARAELAKARNTRGPAVAQLTGEYADAKATLDAARIDEARTDAASLLKTVDPPYVH